MSRPERRGRRRAQLALTLALAAAACGCGKTLPRSLSSKQPTSARHAALAPPAASVTVPLPVTAARVAAFAHAVQLVASDVPGSQAKSRSRTSPAEEREAAECTAHGVRAVGGERSPEMLRGQGLERETISSAVAVLASPAMVRTDLAYAASTAGMSCYARTLQRSLGRERGGQITIGRVSLHPVAISVPGTGSASGVRVTGSIGLTGTRVSVPLFVEAISLAWGPAEIDLYATSFVQPVAERTEQGLLSVLRGRALLHPL